MTKKQRFIWEIYFLLVLLFTVRKTLNFFTPGTESYLYFQILHGFDPLLIIEYIYSFVQVALSLIHLLPFALFIYGIKLYPAVVWQILFVLKVIFDIIGQPFELNFIVSLWYHDPLICLGVFFTSTGIYIPAYIALFMYAFFQKKLHLRKL